MHSQPAYARKMLQIGGRGYVTKNSSKQEMIQAILEVHDGKKFICEEIRNIISDQLMDEKENAATNINASDRAGNADHQSDQGRKFLKGNCAGSQNFAENG